VKWLDEVRATVEAATEGPWVVSVWGHDEEQEPCSWYLHPEREPEHTGLLQSFGDLFRPWLARAEHEANARFAAAARTDVPRLLDLVSALESALRAVDKHDDEWLRYLADSNTTAPPEPRTEIERSWANAIAQVRAALALLDQEAP
jgi:hypothetical protein